VGNARFGVVQREPDRVIDQLRRERLDDANSQPATANAAVGVEGYTAEHGGMHPARPGRYTSRVYDAGCDLEGAVAHHEGSVAGTIQPSRSSRACCASASAIAPARNGNRHAITISP